MEPDIYKRNLTEVTEKSDVLVLGIHPEFHGLSPELVNKVISIELKLIRKFIESEKVKEVELKTMLPLKLISPKRILHLWVVSPTMVSSEMTSSSSRDAVLAPRRDSSYSENP